MKTPDMTELNRTLRETVKSPDFVLNWEEEGAPVWVTFEMTSNGKIDILNIKAPTPRVEQYVRKKLSGIQIANLVNPEGLRYQVKIRFINN
ncbi:MAG TPA: hypothetical protein VMC08_00270 [Bacteroidales bacterium]|nr:hypothetical protein [Bacteroidales bacterium]